MDQQGLLDAPLPEPIITPQPAASEAKRKLEATTTAPPVKTAPPENAPPSFESQHLPTDDSGSKEMLAREENMKFPTSMKLERRKPESRSESITPVPLPTSDHDQLLIGLRAPQEKPYYINTDGSSDEDENSDEFLERPKSPTNGELINTAELIALSTALVARPSAAPGSYNPPSSINENVMRSMAHRPKRIEHGSMSSQPIPIHAPLPLPNTQFNGRLGTSPRPDPSYLAPDEKGNPIPSDAKWTKINRRLVSLEVLNQDGKRYEA